MVEVRASLEKLARAYPQATITMEELATIFPDSEVELELDVTCTEKGAPDKPYEANGDPGEPGWSPEFEYVVAEITLDGNVFSVSGIDCDTLVVDLDLSEEADTEAINKEIHLEDGSNG
jgi:hypothetical protein